MTRPDRDELTGRFPFDLDRFQLDALDGVDNGEHVVVAAPTGSGKTVVAEYAIDAAIRDGRRAFYTAPIKALSNQKYRDLQSVHGDESVGLLTGDHSIRGDAPVVVMTTEVLRNMIYARSARLHDLGVVVLDEVHFLQDAYRGPVWEEVIVHLPAHVRLVCLSATVSNVAELASWIETVRGATRHVVETRRPVALESRYLVSDLTNDRLRLLPTLVGGRPNADAAKLDESGARSGRGRDRGRPERGGTARRSTRPERRLTTPGRVETVELLDERDLLPAIYFIFSRAQCDEAARTCLDAGLRLTTEGERAEIRHIVDTRLAELDADDLEVLGHHRFVAQLEAGFAAHHAGMVPAMKEAVEACFVAGLIRVVFATETLALGINMPARTVVIEKLTKFTGDHHERLTPGDYTQLTGRAGRRGLDEVGDAVVLWSPWVRFDEVAELAASTEYRLRSAFRPTYNMTANLIRTVGHDEARQLVSLSFAQFQADRDVVRLEARLERRRLVLAETRQEAASPYGDLAEYRRLRAEEAERRRAARAATAGQMRGALARLKPGTIIRVAAGRHRGPAVVVSTAHRKDGVRLRLVNRNADLLQATADDFDGPPEPIGSVKLPANHAPHRKEYRRAVAHSLRRARLSASARQSRRDDDARSRSGEHPVVHDPDLEHRLRAAARADRLEAEIADLERRIGSKHQSLAAEFERVLSLLGRLGYADLDAWTLTAAGEMLCRIFHESDLLVAEAIRTGVLDGLGAADLAAVVSCVVYEHRSPEPAPAPWFSSADVERRWRRLAALSEDLRANERSLGLSEHRPPDPTFAAIAHGWVAGEGFAEILDDEDIAGGDFVRTVRQLLDVLRQVAVVAPDPDTRRAAHEAVAGAFRGVVVDSSIRG